MRSRVQQQHSNLDRARSSSLASNPASLKMPLSDAGAPAPPFKWLQGGAGRAADICNDVSVLEGMLSGAKMSIRCANIARTRKQLVRCQCGASSHPLTLSVKLNRSPENRSREAGRGQIRRFSQRRRQRSLVLHREAAAEAAAAHNHSSKAAMQRGRALPPHLHASKA